MLSSIHLIPRSHKLGCINPDHHSGFLTEEQAHQHCDPKKEVCLELQPGDIALLHNYTIHQVRAAPIVMISALCPLPFASLGHQTTSQDVVSTVDLTELVSIGCSLAKTSQIDQEEPTP